jgi:two-component system, chemotaxis family, sensor kinase CheA
VIAPADLKEFVAAYLVEAEDHVNAASSQLLALEASLHQGEQNPRAIRELFRSLHTLKGLSAMVGVEPIVAIAHRLESFLRLADRSPVDLSFQATDTLLKGVQAIEHRLRALGRGDQVHPPPVELLAQLDALDLRLAPPAPPSALDLEPALLDKLASFEVDQLSKGIAAGQRALLAEFSPSPARTAAGLSINSVRERVAKVAEIVRVLPRSVPVSDESPGGLTFVLILLSQAPDEPIAEALGVDRTSLRSIGGLAVRLEAAGETVTPEVILPPLGAEADVLGTGMRTGVVRVDVHRLDEAMEGLSALIVTRFRLARAIAALTSRGVDTRELAQIAADNARQLRDLRAAIVRVRMVPIADLLERVPLLVRGLCRATNRSVRVELEGSGAELDKAVSERLFPVLVHLVRNAVDHAIETPDERVRRGKPKEGLLRITCSARSNTRLELTVSDDGRGIDAKAVARKAGRNVPNDDAGLLELLCIPGLSTRDVATTTSGRGMGMEIVKRVVIDELGGEIELRTEFAVGTTFMLRVPLTLSIVDAFAFECAGQRFVVPVAMVEEIVEVDRAALVGVPGKADGGPGVSLLLRRGSAVPVVGLADVFRVKTGDSGATKAIIVRRAGAPIAFAVDRMLGQQEVVIRPMSDVLIRTPGVSGATDLGDGQPTLVLDLVALSSTLKMPARAREFTR